MLTQKTTLFWITAAHRPDRQEPRRQLWRLSQQLHDVPLGPRARCRRRRQSLRLRTIVDSRPVAAPGSGQDAHLPVPQTTYNDATTGGLYLNPMLQLLTNPLGSLATEPCRWRCLALRRDRPGARSSARRRRPASWRSEPRTSVARSRARPGSRPIIPMSRRTTAALATRPGSSSQALVADEQIDFVTACWMQAMAANPTLDPNTARPVRRAVAAAHRRQQRADPVHQEKLDNNNQKPCAAGRTPGPTARSTRTTPAPPSTASSAQRFARAPPPALAAEHLQHLSLLPRQRLLHSLRRLPKLDQDCPRPDVGPRWPRRRGSRNRGPRHPTPAAPRRPCSRRPRSLLPPSRQPSPPTSARSRSSRHVKERGTRPG